ncbi:FAD dependent oxidoreductase [Actinopolymorpha cephalotaxi]|uniref:FAD dependent oxidoreductase n=2 Tax=Actinopolymorpha cephalotaxi TaxID=504797 RepID=A0A1I2SA13_9ACTN|nr:FAD dependent oxidoreductase [Actinopolymorpha cephalotaxi]
MREMRTEVLVVGGGLGGVAAALTALRLGRRVVLTEESGWLGGQLTSQAVPPDEHPWIESRYASPSYRDLRRRIRDFYRRNLPLTKDAADDPLLNPGKGSVSPLCAEPAAAVTAIHEVLAPYLTAGRLTVLPHHAPVTVHGRGDSVEAVTLRGREGGESGHGSEGGEVTVTAAYVVDATELGDLLALGDVEHVVGAEGQDQTGEPHAPAAANPLDQQAITWCFAVEHRPGEDHTVDPPASYEHWRTHVAPFWPGPQLSWTDVAPETLEPRHRPIFVGDSDADRSRDFWHYRRIVARTNYRRDFGQDFGRGSGRALVESDVTLVNWPQNDYWETPLLGVTEAERERALRESRELSLSLLHWMQTSAPREDGGEGYPGLRLRPDITGTADGLAMRPYVRESRRIRAEFTVTELHVGVEAAGPDGPVQFDDSVGLGNYRIDLHPSAAGRTYVDIDSYPFQIPLGALVPVRVDNLLPANKNIGSTHITNGCYRLHPVEWAIGEAVGALAAYCLDGGRAPREVSADPVRRGDYQRLLTDGLGIELAWPREIRTLSTSRRPAYPQLVE